MALPVIFVRTTMIPYSGTTRMIGTPTSSIEDRPLPRRFYTFNMVITHPFTFENTDMLELTDNGGTNVYHMIDRLGNPVIAEQLKMYAGTRRCLPCRYDSVTNTITTLCQICPTNKYINEWLNPPTEAAKVSEK